MAGNQNKKCFEINLGSNEIKVTQDETWDNVVIKDDRFTSENGYSQKLSFPVEDIDNVIQMLDGVKGWIVENKRTLKQS